MNRIILCAILSLSLCLIGCNKQNKPKTDPPTVESKQKAKQEMKSHISIFEIPATDISRAANFYQEILDIKIEKMEMPGMEMGIFPYEEHIVTGVLIKAEGYIPTANGVTIYLNGGDNLQTILDKVQQSGGKILVQKTAHADESGFFALFLDSEGNKLGLHSLN